MAYLGNISENIRLVMKKTKNIVISGTNFWNPGDDFVRDGVIRILKELFPDYTLNFHFYNFNQDFFPQSKFSGIHNMVSEGDLDKYADFIDYIVIAGLSAGNEIKDLYNWIISNNLEKKVILIGAGYENKYVAKHILEEPEKTIFKNARIITSRTKKHPELIDELKLPFHHINCPAILSVKKVKRIQENKRIEKIAFSIQIPPELEGIPNHQCSATMYKLAMEIFIELYGKYEISIIAHHKSEYFHFLNLIKRFNLDAEVYYSSYYQDLFEIYPKFDLVITTRLHSSLFANGFGTPGIIINDTDRHTHCLEGFNHSVWIDSKDKFYNHFDQLLQSDLGKITSDIDQFKEELLAKYLNILRERFYNNEEEVNGKHYSDMIWQSFKFGAASISTKKAVLNNFKKLEPDYWLENNILNYEKMIENNDDSSFDLVSFLYWYAGTYHPRNYLEIGVRRGRSMIQVLSASPDTKIHGFDLWIEDYSSLPEKGVITTNPGIDFVLSEIKKFSEVNIPTLTKGFSQVELPNFFNNTKNVQLFDLITVDGDHTYEGAKQDLLITFEHLAPGGILVFDDIAHPSHPELLPLWNEFKEQFSDFLFFEEMSGSGTAFAVKPPFNKYIVEQ